MTLFTLDDNKKVLLRNLIIYLGVVIFCVAFGFIYESFSHGVVSYFMLLGFLVPLVLGVVPYLLLFLLKKKGFPNYITSCLYNGGVAVVTVGCFFKGFLEIYGTTRKAFEITYFIIGIFLLILGVIFYIISILKTSRKNLDNTKE